MTNEHRAQRDAVALRPLEVSKANPRYFTVASGDAADRVAVYLTGLHIWNNFHDGMGPGSDCAEAPELLDYDAYLGFLEDHATISSDSGAGAVQVPGGRRRLSPLHGAATVAADRAGGGEGRQAEVRPVEVR